MDKKVMVDISNVDSFMKTKQFKKWYHQLSKGMSKKKRKIIGMFPDHIITDEEYDDADNDCLAKYEADKNNHKLKENK